MLGRLEMVEILAMLEILALPNLTGADETGRCSSVSYLPIERGVRTASEWRTICVISSRAFREQVVWSAVRFAAHTINCIRLR